MKFGVSYNTGYYGVDPGALVAVARHAEDRGFESFYVPEHIALYPGAAVYGHPIPPSTPVADPLECLSFVAAATERILLGTGVLLLPYHHPVVLAKRLATAARRAGRRGDGYFPGGRLTDAERASQIEIMRAAAREAGRDPDVLEYTRWGTIDMTPDDVDTRAARGTTRLVVAPASTDLPEQLDQLSAFAKRHGL